MHPARMWRQLVSPVVGVGKVKYLGCPARGEMRIEIVVLCNICLS